jgi:hypothetical protein
MFGCADRTIMDESGQTAVHYANLLCKHSLHSLSPSHGAPLPAHAHTCIHYAIRTALLADPSYVCMDYEHMIECGNEEMVVGLLLQQISVNVFGVPSVAHAMQQAYSADSLDTSSPDGVVEGTTFRDNTSAVVTAGRSSKLPPLFLAIKHINISIVRDILYLGRVDVDYRRADTLETALIFAVKTFMSACTEASLQPNAYSQLDATNNIMKSTVNRHHVQRLHDCVVIVAMLLRASASRVCTDRTGLSALDYATQQVHASHFTNHRADDDNVVNYFDDPNTVYNADGTVATSAGTQSGAAAKDKDKEPRQDIDEFIRTCRLRIYYLLMTSPASHTLYHACEQAYAQLQQLNAQQQVSTSSSPKKPQSQQQLQAQTQRQQLVIETACASVYALIAQGADVNAMCPVRRVNALAVCVFARNVQLLSLLLHAQVISDETDFSQNFPTATFLERSVTDGLGASSSSDAHTHSSAGHLEEDADEAGSYMFEVWFPVTKPPRPAPLQVNAACKEGMTAVHFAAQVRESFIAHILDDYVWRCEIVQIGDSNIAGMLVAAGADRQIQNEGKQTALDIASRRGNLDTISLLKYDPNTVPICLASKHGDWVVMSALLRQGISINTTRPTNIPLVAATATTNTQAALMMQANAQYKQQLMQPQLPQAQAVTSVPQGQAPGASTKTSYETYTPLIAAVVHKKTDILQHILAIKQINLDLQNELGRTALMYATLNGS